MGTSAKFGFYYKGKYYLAFNKFDSYPKGLGYRLILELLNADFDEWIKLLENIKEVSEDDKITPEDIKKLEKYTWDIGPPSNFYCLLYHTQGSFHHVLHSGYIVNIAEDDEIDLDYTYIVDLDNKEFRGQGYDLDMTVKLERKELIKYALEWSGGDSNFYYNPEDALKAMKAMNFLPLLSSLK